MLSESGLKMDLLRIYYLKISVVTNDKSKVRFNILKIVDWKFSKSVILRYFGRYFEFFKYNSDILLLATSETTWNKFQANLVKWQSIF